MAFCKVGAGTNAWPKAVHIHTELSTMNTNLVTSKVLFYQTPASPGDSESLPLLFTLLSCSRFLSVVTLQEGEGRSASVFRLNVIPPNLLR